MNILMITNTYIPHVGGVANSVHSYKLALERLGHNVLVIAPHFDNEKEDNTVLRVEAVQNFNGSDFSLTMPTLMLKYKIIEAFQPDIIHSHHPFLLGISALRIAGRRKIPIVFTHHTLYEHYTHYVPFESKLLKKVAKNMAVVYCNLCDGIIAPSHSIKSLLKKRGVQTKTKVIPTGITPKNKDNHKQKISEFAIKENSFVIGHVSRLALEKNQHFLAEAVSLFLKNHKDASFLIVGDGQIKDELKDIFRKNGVYEQVIFAGKQSGDSLQALYEKMDLFVFSSKSETQGMVIAEALLAKTPVVALDASAISEMIDKTNGYLVKNENYEDFAAAIKKIYTLEKDELERLKEGSFKSAEKYTMDMTVKKLVTFYKKNIKTYSYSKNETEYETLSKNLRTLSIEYEIWKTRAQSLVSSDVVDKSLNKIKELKNIQLISKQKELD